jgi:hypothetical protein
VQWKLGLVINAGRIELAAACSLGWRYPGPAKQIGRPDQRFQSANAITIPPSLLLRADQVIE